MPADGLYLAERGRGGPNGTTLRVFRTLCDAQRAAARTFCTVSLHQHRCALLDAADDPLAHLGENAINYSEIAGHSALEVKVAAG